MSLPAPAAGSSAFADAAALIAHERADERAFAATIVRAAGLGRAQQAQNASEALWMLGQDRYAVMVIDWELGGMNAVQFTRAVRRLEDAEKRAVPILLLSARAGRADIDTALRAGVNSYVVKPVAPATLEKRLRPLIDNPRPFIVTDSYVGPCRRRSALDAYAGPWRRKDDAAFTAPLDDDRIDPKVLMRARARAHVDTLVLRLAAFEERAPDAMARFLSEAQSLRRVALQLGDAELEMGAAALSAYVNADHAQYEAARTHLDALRHLTSPTEIPDVMRRAVAGELTRMAAKAKARGKS